MQELYAELKQRKGFDPDKVTFGTYYQALLLCKKNQLRVSEKASYIPEMSNDVKKNTSESDFDDFLERQD